MGRGKWGISAEHPLGGRGWASLRVAPTTLLSKDQRKIRETESSKYSLLRLLDQTFDCNGVGASRRPAHPGLRPTR